MDKKRPIFISIVEGVKHRIHYLSFSPYELGACMEFWTGESCFFQVNLVYPRLLVLVESDSPEFTARYQVLTRSNRQLWGMVKPPIWFFATYEAGVTYRGPFGAFPRETHEMFLLSSDYPRQLCIFTAPVEKRKKSWLSDPAVLVSCTKVPD